MGELEGWGAATAQLLRDEEESSCGEMPHHLPQSREGLGGRCCLTPPNHRRVERTGIRCSERNFLAGEVFQESTWMIFLPDGVCFLMEKLSERLYAGNFCRKNSDSPARNATLVRGLHSFLILIKGKGTWADMGREFKAPSCHMKKGSQNNSAEAQSLRSKLR